MLKKRFTKASPPKEKEGPPPIINTPRPSAPPFENPHWPGGLYPDLTPYEKAPPPYTSAPPPTYEEATK
ncbi:hypothetical protein HAT2_00695 [Candidatus Similichlamydia laticola]|uniref:Uncharacterized protein n=1 Tax=Candidatus Similichlamydia laticola TaxID=2170265 RepID=A0A369KEU3_9BACT|nr:hypothetical protein HAT2_00695 [Candidatus Similichlamydia laticola]